MNLDEIEDINKTDLLILRVLFLSNWETTRKKLVRHYLLLCKEYNSLPIKSSYLYARLQFLLRAGLISSYGKQEVIYCVPEEIQAKILMYVNATFELIKIQKVV